MLNFFIMIILNFKMTKMNQFKTNILTVLFSILAVNFAMGQTKHQCDYTCSPHQFSIRFYASPLMTKLKSDTYSSEVKSKFGYNFGTDLSYYFVNKGKFKSSISLGLGLTKYNSEYNLNYADSAWAYDVDNQEVFIRENLDGYNENQGILYLDIPVKLGFEYAFSTRLDAYLNLGLTYGIAIQNEYDNSGILTRTGYYPDYNALIYDVDVPGSPYFYPTNKAMAGGGAFNAQNNLGFEAAVGLKYKLNLKWSVFGGIKIMNGFQNIKDGDGMMTQISASDYQLNSITNRNDKISARAIGAEFGLALNLGKCRNAPVEEVEELVIEPVIQNVDVNYTLVDTETNKPVNATVMVKENGQTIQSLTCDENGQAKVSLPADKTYTFEYAAENYISQSETVNLSGANRGIQKNIILVPVQKAIIIEEPRQIDATISVLDSKTGNPLKAIIELKKDGQVIQTINCDNNGQALITIEENKDYAITVNSDGYLYQYDKLDFGVISKNPKREFKLDPIVKKETNIELRPIRFQSGLGNISPESKETLNIILRMLKENPAMQIEISGHADNVGNKDSNKRLSLKRAQAIVDYLVAEGANPEQLKAIGYGSDRPIADNSTEEGRSKNRRVEFKVSKY
jgi:outer membrane protein OmpA-like peptidoglycan-associated protein